ncbi:CatB-related O-acetyltransferase [Hymenobacter saemangeumensis]|uniref:CatB-related O-acetyltransferase n=1 Tax=Hymenobacter saemangeumensis TaxID=1084522 RepID=A0ABP8IQ35_9BACT
MPLPSTFGPHPDTLHPAGGQQRLVFLKNIIQSPQIEVGDYTYYDDPEDVGNFERNVLYHFPFIGDKLIIGRYCMLAAGVRFVMNGGNHRTAGFSSYPFAVFGQGWEHAFPLSDFPVKGDTVVGHDVWIGHDALIMPGVQVGNGAIIATRAVVTRDVPAFAVVAGNPATVVRMRFDADTIARLEALAWWHWDAEKLARNLPAVCGSDLAALEQAR